MRFANLTLLLMTVTATPVAPADGSAGNAISIGEARTLRSEILGEERALRVRTPTGYAHSDERFPVLLLLDGETNFHLTTATTDILAENGFAPEMIVVGIDNTRRNRDLSPTPLPRFPGSGGAGAFERFLVEELVPWLDREYRTAPHRVLVGHSLGGLLGVHLLVTKPGHVQSTLAISPGLFWDKGLVERLAQKRFAETERLDASLFLCLANEPEGMLRGYENFELFLEDNSPQGLRWKSARYADETHGSIPLRGTYDGLRWLFEGWSWNGIVKEKGLAELDAHFARLTERFGFEARPPEVALIRLASRLSGEKRAAEAVQALKRNVELRPTSPEAYFHLGDLRRKVGDRMEALEAFERACELGEEQGSPRLELFRTNRDRLRGKKARRR